MWINTQDGTTAVNMNHVAFIQLKGGDEDVAIRATMVTDQNIVLHVCTSGGEARDWLKDLLAMHNARKV